MSELNITLINVGTGDSIFIESIDFYGKKHFGLIDSNDSDQLRHTKIFIKHYCEAKGINTKSMKHFFNFVLMTHSHLDHGQGLKNIMKEYGTENFYYPNCHSWGGLTPLLNYANRSVRNGGRIGFNQAIDDGVLFNNLGDAAIQVLWPKAGQGASSNENDNSVVLKILLNGVSIILSGDAEEAVWSVISTSIPTSTKFFKVPHHGSRNGTFDSHGNSLYLDELDVSAPDAILGISCHPVPHGHPDAVVTQEFDQRAKRYYRTDEHHNISFRTDGSIMKIKYQTEQVV